MMFLKKCTIFPQTVLECHIMFFTRTLLAIDCGLNVCHYIIICTVIHCMYIFILRDLCRNADLVTYKCSVSC